jgi:hypothetical protein
MDPLHSCVTYFFKILFNNIPKLRLDHSSEIFCSSFWPKFLYCTFILCVMRATSFAHLIIIRAYNNNNNNNNNNTWLAYKLRGSSLCCLPQMLLIFSEAQMFLSAPFSQAPYLSILHIK